MDAKTPVLDEWQPEWRHDGSVEISVNYYHENGRRTFDSVSLAKYLELLRSGALVWQQDRKPRPEHNPTEERTLALLEEQKSRRAHDQSFAHQNGILRSAVRNTGRPRVSFEDPAEDMATDEPGFVEDSLPPPTPAPRPVKSVSTSNPDVGKVARLKLMQEVKQKQEASPPEPPPTNLQAGETLDIESCVIRIERELTPRDREVVADIVAGRVSKGMTAASHEARKSGLCSKIGIPKVKRHHGYDRLGALKQVWTAYLEKRKGIKPEGKLDTPPPTAQQMEHELLRLFRAKKYDVRQQILAYVRSLPA